LGSFDSIFTFAVRIFYFYQKNKMTRFLKILLPIVFGVLMACNSCKTDSKTGDKPPIPVVDMYQKPAIQLPVPAFSQDSAFKFIEKQLSFGPRVPNSAAAVNCQKYFVKEFNRLGAKVTEQSFSAKRYDGVDLKGTNIIAQYRPENKRRILLSAHWDSRFMSDQDAKNKTSGVPAADDGASGVGVLLEIARLLQNNPVDIGIDIILWDLEDQGSEQNTESWCLGSQYWVKNKHFAGALFGINLDMVGAKGARFPKERNSMVYAPKVVEKTWALANSMGFGQYFVQDFGGPITDDHAVVSEIGQIPTIDIINLQAGQRTFGAHWHTQNDNISVIDKNVLQAVGQTVTAVIYRSYNGTF
jgi:glutaminyl-peptide cyclotransferase